MSDQSLTDMRIAVQAIVQSSGGIEQAAKRAHCSPRTICRILTGHNVTIRTAAKIVAAHGAVLRVMVERKT